MFSFYFFFFFFFFLFDIFCCLVCFYFSSNLFIYFLSCYSLLVMGWPVSFVLALFAPPTHSWHSVSFAERFEKEMCSRLQTILVLTKHRRLGCREGGIVGSRQSEDLFAAMLLFLLFLFFSLFPASLPLISRVCVSPLHRDMPSEE